MSAMEVCS